MTVRKLYLGLCGLLMACCVVGCVTAQHARELYADEVAGFVGKPLAEARRPFKGRVGSTEPTAQKQLKNGNILHIYNSDNVNGLCNLVVEFNPETRIIVTAHPEGPGCLTPY